MNHVRNQSKQPTFSFIVCRRGLGLGQVFSNFLRPCAPSGFRCRSIIPKISYDKKADENRKYIYCTNKHLLILKIILTDVDVCINASISKWIICKHNFSLPLLTSNVPFQIGKSTPWGTCIPGCEPLVWYYLRLGFKAGVTKLLPQTQSCCLVQIHAKVYQFDTHTSENKNLHDLSSYDVIIRNKN